MQKEQGREHDSYLNTLTAFSQKAERSANFLLFCSKKKKIREKAAAKLYKRAGIPWYQTNCCILFFLKFLAIIFYSLLSSLLWAMKTDSKRFSEVEPAHLCSLSLQATNQSLNFKLNHWLLLLLSSSQSVYSRRRQILAGACEAGSVVRGEPKRLIFSIKNWQIGCKISKSSCSSCCILSHLATNPPDILFLNSKHCMIQELHNEHRVNKGEEGHRERAEQRHLLWVFYLGSRKFTHTSLF